MRAPHIVLAVLVSAGIAASLAVIPRDRELALMYLKGLDYASAQTAPPSSSSLSRCSGTASWAL